MKRTPMTMRGAEALRNELKKLKSESRPNVIKAIAEAHNFPPDFPSPDAASALYAACLGQDGFFSLVAEIDGTII